MSNISKTIDSVFGDCTENELEFDTIFDQEDCLIDTVNGVNESGDPLTGTDFEELHQTDDDATPEDIKDELGEGHDTKNGSPDPEGAEKEEQVDTSVKGEVDKPSDADKFHGDSEEEYQDDSKDPKPEENDVTGTIDKAVEEGLDIDHILDPVAETADNKEDQLDEGDPVQESNPDIDSVLDPVGEASGADTDVKDIVDDEQSSDSVDIDKILDGDDSSSGTSNLNYDLSDEDLIDIAINGDK